MMIIGLSKLTDDAYYKFNQFDGFPGYLIMTIRIGLFIYFVYGLKSTLQKAREKIKSFGYKLTILGTVYFISLPMIIIISYFMEPYVRN